MLKYVDRFGDTIFNCVQMDDLPADIERLTACASIPSHAVALSGFA